jgi:hypothetical protein
MTQRWRRLLIAMALATGLSGGAQAQDKPVADQAISALASFAVAYGGWIWETRCNELSSADHLAFQEKIEGQLLRLNAIFEPRMVGAATGAGREAVMDPEMGECGGESKGYSEFGMSLADEIDETLRAIPTGYRLTVTD